jgi:hypothetical protein
MIGIYPRDRRLSARSASIRVIGVYPRLNTKYAVSGVIEYQVTMSFGLSIAAGWT